MDAPAQTPGFHAAIDPDRLAIMMAGSGGVVTYGQLEEGSARLGRGLRAAGVRPGDHIAMLLDNRAEMLELAWAAQRSGLYYTPINTRLAADEAAYVTARISVTSVALIASNSLRRFGRLPFGKGWPGRNQVLRAPSSISCACMWPASAARITGSSST